MFVGWGVFDVSPRCAPGLHELLPMLHDMQHWQGWRTTCRDSSKPSQ